MNFYEDYRPINLYCIEDIPLDKKEKILVDLTYWARNSIKGLSEAKKFGLYSGPKGHRDARGWWWPDPAESCDAPISHVKYSSNKSHEYDPWAWYKHCKSKQHITYLVKNRLNYILGFLWKNYDVLNYLSRMLYENPRNIPLSINSDNKIIKRFAIDSLANNYFNLDDYIVSMPLINEPAEVPEYTHG